MRAFIVEAQNKPGELAKVARSIADKGINIQSGAVLGLSGNGGFGLITADEAGTRTALKEANCKFKEVEVLPVEVEDRPGALAEIAKKLGDKGINIDLMLPIGMSGDKMKVALGVDKVDAAREAIGQKVASTV